MGKTSGEAGALRLTAIDTLCARAACVVGAAMILLHLFWMYQGLRTARDVLGTKESLRRLSALTVRNFPDRSLETPDLFWKAIGREGQPMLDLWGNEYKVEIRMVGDQRQYAWQSAGPDRQWNTADDVHVDVPYAIGLGAGEDPSPDDFQPVKPPSTNAK